MHKQSKDYEAQIDELYKQISKLTRQLTATEIGKAPQQRQVLDTLLIPKSSINKERKGYCVLLQRQNVCLLPNDKLHKNTGLPQYQGRMYNLFFPNDIVCSGFSLSYAKGIISDFKKVCQDAELITELKLCFAEYGNMYGDIDERFYNAVCDVFHDVIEVAAGDRELLSCRRILWHSMGRRRGLKAADLLFSVDVFFG